MLDGSGSHDPDNDSLTFSWSFVSKPEGSTAVLNAPDSEAPSFTVDVPGNYLISLVVTDGIYFSEPDTVTIKTRESGGRIVFMDLIISSIPIPIIALLMALAESHGQTGLSIILKNQGGIPILKIVSPIPL